jgi:hypothetical protein
MPVLSFHHYDLFAENVNAACASFNDAQAALYRSNAIRYCAMRACAIDNIVTAGTAA